jgi:hypothetical protein
MSNHHVVRELRYFRPLLLTGGAARSPGNSCCFTPPVELGLFSRWKKQSCKCSTVSGNGGSTSAKFNFELDYERLPLMEKSRCLLTP